VGWAAVAIAAMVVSLLAVAGTDEAGLRLVIRATARTSVVLFALAFTASSLRRVWPGRASAWLVGNRRYLGVAFAVSHLAHLLAIFALAGWSGRRLVEMTEPVVLVFGGLAYLFIAAMTVTSFDRSAAWLGPRRWQRLHTVGAYFIWFIFTLNFVPLAFSSPLYWPFALALVSAFALRMAARRRFPQVSRAPSVQTLAARRPDR
jgi:hypothetical protein